MLIHSYTIKIKRDTKAVFLVKDMPELKSRGAAAPYALRRRPLTTKKFGAIICVTGEIFGRFFSLENGAGAGF